MGYFRGFTVLVGPIARVDVFLVFVMGVRSCSFSPAQAVAPRKSLKWEAVPDRIYLMYPNPLSALRISSSLFVAAGAPAGAVFARSYVFT